MEHFLKTIKECVNPATLPVAVNLLQDLSSVDSLKIKVKGKRLAICQQIAYSRYYGWSTLTDSHSAHCVLGAACTGLVKAPKRVLDGSVNCGVYQKDSVAAAEMQRLMPRVSQNITGVLTYPLSRPFDGIIPDLVVLYLNSAQTMRMIQAFLYHGGGEFVMRSSGDAGVCSRAVAQVFMTGEPTVEIPCMGDRRFAMTQDHEIAVGIPFSWLGRTTEGLEATHKAGIRYPVPFQIPAECELPHTYTTSTDDI